MKTKTLRLVASIGLVAGLGISALALWNLIGSEQQASNNQQALAEEVPLVVNESAAGDGVSLKTGEVFAKLRAPRLGENYVRQIAEGTSMNEVLNKVGIGRYRTSSLPGEIGNFALAGHRAGNGGPFRNIDQFQAGDLVYVETAEAVFTYRYLETKVVAPDEVGVIAAFPEGMSVQTSNDKFLTLTTCTPIYINTERLIVWFEQVSVDPK